MILMLAALVGTIGLGQSARPVAPGRQIPLPIDLIGIVINQGSPDKSVCLLRSAAPGGATILAQAGDTVFQIAVVRAIDPNDVFLENLATNGIEILHFGERAGPVRKPAPAPVPAPLPAVAPDAPPEQERVIPKSVVDHYRANLKDILDAATVAPRLRTVEGRSMIDGFEIRNVKKGSIVDQLGFRAGDVILEVNGAKLDGLDKVVSAYQGTREATRVELTVLRDGKTRTLSFSQK
jgi:type II secretory pathway component PulC